MEKQSDKNRHEHQWVMVHTFTDNYAHLHVVWARHCGRLRAFQYPESHYFGQLPP